MQRRDKRDSNVSWSVSERRVTKPTAAYRPAVDSLESKLGSSHMSIFSQSAEREARAAPNGVKKGATFLLVFRCLNLTASSRKAFNGVQKGQVHSKKHKPSKKYFCWRSISGSPPAGLKEHPTKNLEEHFSLNIWTLIYFFGERSLRKVHTHSPVLQGHVWYKSSLKLRAS